MKIPTTRAVVITAPGKAEVRQFSTRPLQPHELRVANTFSGVSLGTEYQVVSGQFHDCPLPCLLGYQGVGRISEVGPEVNGYKIGDRVCAGSSNYHPDGFGVGCGNAHQSHPIVSDKGDWAQSELAHIPPGVTDDEAAYAWLVSVSLQGVERAKVGGGDVVAVVGLGLVGQFAAQAARARGARVYACDLVAERAAQAQQHSADVAVAGDTAALEKRLRADYPNGATVVIECTGNTKALDAALELAVPEGRVVLQGHYPGNVTFRFLASHMKRLTLLCPCAWTDLRVALALIGERKIIVRPFLRDICAPEQAPELYARLYRRDPELLAALIRWS